MDESLQVRHQVLVAVTLCMVPQAWSKWWLIVKIKQPWRSYIRRLKQFANGLTWYYTPTARRFTINASRQFRSAPF